MLFSSLHLYLIYIIPAVLAVGLNEEFTWTRINYDWSRFPRRNVRQTKYNGGKPSPKTKPDEGILFPGLVNTEDRYDRGMMSSGRPPSGIDYQFENNIPMGANVWKDKLFITVPRRRLGVPSTLNYVPLNSKHRHNVPLIPYPNAEMNLYPGPSNGQNFLSVYRVGVDSCDRLWFADTGNIELPGNVTRIQPSTLTIIDLNTDKIIHRHVFPTDVLRSNTNLASITIDVDKHKCNDAYAYFPDLAGFGLVVFSLKDNRSWRVSHNYFFVEPSRGEFFVAGHSFQWNDGIFSVELSDVKRDGSKDVYFHSMAGTHVYRVSNRILKNETLATRSYHGNDFEDVGDRGDLAQTSSAFLHQPTGVIFLALVNQNALGCWRTGQPANVYGVVHRDNVKMIYPSDVKVYKNRVFVLTNAMPQFLYGRLDYDQTNFRVWSKDVIGAIESTSCAL